jgi:hypothetical protein
MVRLIHRSVARWALDFALVSAHPKTRPSSAGRARQFGTRGETFPIDALMRMPKYPLEGTAA